MTHTYALVINSTWVEVDADSPSAALDMLKAEWRRHFPHGREKRGEVRSFRDGEWWSVRPVTIEAGPPCP